MIAVASRGPTAVQCGFGSAGLAPATASGLCPSPPPASSPSAASWPGRRRPAALVAAISADLVLDRPERRLGATREVELAEDVRDMGAGGPLGDVEQGRDLLVRV